MQKKFCTKKTKNFDVNTPIARLTADIAAVEKKLKRIFAMDKKGLRCLGILLGFAMLRHKQTTRQNNLQRGKGENETLRNFTRHFVPKPCLFPNTALPTWRFFARIYRTKTNILVARRKIMSKTPEKQKKETAKDVILAIFCVALMFALFATIMVLAGSRTVGKITYEGEVRQGKTQVFSYRTDKVKKGETVTWYVDNVKKDSYNYDGQNADFACTFDKTGNSTVRVVAGRFNQSVTVEVLRPLLTVRAKDVTVTYGETTAPVLTFETSGLLPGDTLQKLGCKIQLVAENDGTQCGEWKISVLPFQCEGYDVQTVDATLTVLPKQLKITETVQKVYDGTTNLDNTQLKIEGVVFGDDVQVLLKNTQLPCKNAGKYILDGNSICIEGTNCKNYTVEGEVCVEVLPKGLTLQGLTVQNKTYDGTTKADIVKLGKLQGVVEGDSVAIGNLEVKFDAADVGTHAVKVKNILLVGMDKHNYFVQNVVVNNGEILRQK